jgi:hypothetical protein
MPGWHCLQPGSKMVARQILEEIANWAINRGAEEVIVTVLLRRYMDKAR